MVSESKRVVFLRSNPIDPDPRVEKSVNSLAKAGYHVNVLGWDRFGKSEPFEKFGFVKIIRLSIQADFGTGIRNLPTLLRWQWGLSRWLIKHHHEFDIIHACDFDTVIPAIMSKILWRKKVIYDIFDFYADHLRSTPEWIKGIIRFLDKLCIRWVDAIVLADEARIAQISGIHPSHVVIIYNTPKDLYSLQERTENSKTSNQLCIVYVGLLQLERGILEVMDVLKKYPNWSFEIAGFGGDEEIIEKRANDLENVHWHGRITYNQALELSGTADVLFATYDPIIPNHRFSSPNKVFEAMMLGIPIIVSRGTNIDRRIEQHNCGLVVDYGNVTQLENALCLLAENFELRSQLGENARKAYEHLYNYDEMESRLVSLYESIPS